MLLKSIQNKAKKLGLKLVEGKYIYSSNRSKVMKILKNSDSDEAFALKVRRVNDHSDYNSDYHSGTMLYSLKSAFNELERN